MSVVARARPTHQPESVVRRVDSPCRPISVSIAVWCISVDSKNCALASTLAPGWEDAQGQENPAIVRTSAAPDRHVRGRRTSKDEVARAVDVAAVEGEVQRRVAQVVLAVNAVDRAGEHAQGAARGELQRRHEVLHRKQMAVRGGGVQRRPPAVILVRGEEILPR